MRRGGEGVTATWRDSSRPIIAKVLAETQGQDEKSIRRALTAAYPWGERRMWPYKVWLDEIKRQRGLKVSKKPPQRALGPNPGQLDLFERQA